jgi:ligand-binding SRPBCC domain-containing protein
MNIVSNPSPPVRPSGGASAALIHRLLAADAQPPARGVLRFQASAIVPASLDSTFAFFADAANLQRLTPPWVNFRILTPMPVVMREGLEIDYRIAIHGVPMPWRSRIDVWEPGVRFVDRQIWGPYRWWRHEHRFEPVGLSTRVIDEVAFVPRLRLFSGRIVRRDVERIFAYRQQALAGVFGDRDANEKA